MKTAELFPPIPSETAKAARAVFGSGNFYMAIGDQANRLFHGLIEIDPRKTAQKPARVLAQLYLITIFQYLETLPDSQAADAVRQRRDWKYALHLPLNVPAFADYTYHNFRKFLLADEANLQTLQALLSRLSELDASINSESLNLRADQIVVQVCLFSRLVKVWNSISWTLEDLVIKQPDWLRAHSLPHWYGRYSHPHGELNLRADRSELERLAEAIGADGFYLLEAITGEPELADLPEITSLRQVWAEQYELVEGKVFWRKDTCASSSGISRQWDPLERIRQS